MTVAEFIDMLEDINSVLQRIAGSLEGLEKIPEPPRESEGEPARRFVHGFVLALRFYADPDSYEHQPSGRWPVLEDSGATARIALERAGLAQTQGNNENAR